MLDCQGTPAQAVVHSECREQSVDRPPTYFNLRLPLSKHSLNLLVMIFSYSLFLPVSSRLPLLPLYVVYIVCLLSNSPIGRCSFGCIFTRMCPSSAASFPPPPLGMDLFLVDSPDLSLLSRPVVHVSLLSRPVASVVHFRYCILLSSKRVVFLQLLLQDSGRLGVS